MEIAFSGYRFVFFIVGITHHRETEVLHLGTTYTIDASVVEVNFCFS